MSAQAFTPFCDFQAGWVGPESSMGRFWLKYFLSVFHFSETGISLFN
jgi:hypothetical protein